jgi:hypothetical protein
MSSSPTRAAAPSPRSTRSPSSRRPRPSAAPRSASTPPRRPRSANFARSWALDLKDRAIRVNALSPGPTETPGLLGLVPEDQQQGLLDALTGEVPLGRVADAAEIAAAALFLGSDESSFVNGSELFADGGQAQV